jgi:biopolymer transport protein TolR
LSLGARRGAKRGDLPLTAEINITSLVDVAFTLLVIFIITAPVLQGGIEVAVPEGEVTSISSQDDPFIVSVDAAGTIYVGETPVDREVFAETFPRLLNAAGADMVYIRADGGAVYGSVYHVITTVAATEGVRVYGLVGEQIPAPRR